MNCIIVDDELPARELLADNIRQFTYLNLLGQARNAAEALVLLAREKVDLMFLDIQMPGLTGLELLSSLRRQPLVILVTAFEEHALEGFGLDVVDYLVKPVPFPRFAKAVQKANELYQWRELALQKASPVQQEHVFVNANYALVKVALDDIILIEGLGDYVKIWLTPRKEIITRLSLKSVEEKLDPARFMRVHKSYIIAVRRIESVQKTQLIIDGREIPIGDNYRATLQAYLDDKGF
jgi:two-component system LytT family response regulator